MNGKFSTRTANLGLGEAEQQVVRILKMDGEPVTEWTIRISLLAYFGSLLLRWTGDGTARLVAARLLWTAGCLLLLIHVACAFHFYHDWSHRRAFEQTAAETRSQIGWSFGAGIYFNYLLIAIWCFDVAWWWAAPEGYRRRHAAIPMFFHGYLFFIAFQAVVIFETGPIRWIGAAAAAILVILFVCRVLAKKGEVFAA